VGRRRPLSPAPLLLRALSLLGQGLTLLPVSCLAEQEQCHRHRIPELAVDARSQPQPLEPFVLLESVAEEAQRVRRRPAVAQPPSSTLGEPRHPTAVARVRV
jgi:hypothetical protein